MVDISAKVHTASARTVESAFVCNCGVGRRFQLRYERSSKENQTRFMERCGEKTLFKKSDFSMNN
jgi:hypothetical protein